MFKLTKLLSSRIS